MNKQEAFKAMSSYRNQDVTEVDSLKKRLLNNIKNLKHTILVGPPGTGKTRLVSQLLLELKESDSLGVNTTIQFHPQYSYQDFIEGYTVREGVFDYREGVFKNFIRSCDESKLNIFVIDEINRADISSVFGELLMLLDREKGKSVTLPASGASISMPENTVIVGTMNSADKNIAIMDFALRRRFGFLFVPPDYDGLVEWLNLEGLGLNDIGIEEYIKAIKNLNQRILIHPLLGKNMTLGQSFFVPKTKEDELITDDSIAQQFSEAIVPQIETYLGHGNSNDLSAILSPAIAAKLRVGEEITKSDVIDLIKMLANSQESMQ
jgi:5-methylcytosine-specific restriction protein B